MKNILKKAAATTNKEKKVTANPVFKPDMPVYLATPSISRGGFESGVSENVHVTLLSDGRYGVCLAAANQKKTAYAVFNSPEELQEQMNISLL